MSQMPLNEDTRVDTSVSKQVTNQQFGKRTFLRVCKNSVPHKQIRVGRKHEQVFGKLSGQNQTNQNNKKCLM